MKSKEHIDRLVEETLESVSNRNKVKVPPFFKDKALQRMAQPAIEEKEGLRYLDWFTPNYQAAALICFVILNSAVLLSYTSDDYSEHIENFAEVYGLSETDTESYLYQN